jgi:hypothetical protein
MKPDESILIIDEAGGDKAFAETLGIASESGYAQRVNNWRRRGIPSDVVLQHLDVIRRLQKAATSKSGARVSVGR